MQVTEVRQLRLLPLLIFLLSPFAQAQDKQTEEIPTKHSQTQSLQRELQQRDQVILELLERVEALERELGVHPAKSKPITTPDPQPVTDQQTQSQAETVDNKTAPGLVVADESVAERALERSLTRDGVLLLPAGVLEIEPRFVYSRQEDATPSFVTSGSGVLASETERNSDSLTAGLLFRLGLPGDSQLEVGIPYRWRSNETVTTVNFIPTQVSSQSGNAPGDVRITLAKTFLREESGQPDVIGRLTWDTDTGKPSDNGVALGGGFHEVLASLSFIKRQDPVVFVSGLAYQYTFEENSIQPGEIFSANFGSYIALNPQTSLNITLAMAYEKETKLAGSRFAGSDRTIGTLIIGGSTLLGRGTLLNLSVGIGLTDDADDFSVSLSLPVRFDSRVF